MASVATKNFYGLLYGLMQAQTTLDAKNMHSSGNLTGTLIDMAGGNSRFDQRDFGYIFGGYYTKSNYKASGYASPTLYISSDKTELSEETTTFSDYSSTEMCLDVLGYKPEITISGNAFTAIYKNVILTNNTSNSVTFSRIGHAVWTTIGTPEKYLLFVIDLPNEITLEAGQHISLDLEYTFTH